jgi:hypothetical protein
VKTLIFAVLLLFFGLKLSVKATDPYTGLTWSPVAEKVLSFAHNSPIGSSLDTFRNLFLHSPYPPFRDLIGRCGIPAGEWADNVIINAKDKIPTHMPMYHGGHLFRYNPTDGGHVYIWTSEEDGTVMRAEYFPITGKKELLFKATL